MRDGAPAADAHRAWATTCCWAATTWTSRSRGVEARLAGRRLDAAARFARSCVRLPRSPRSGSRPRARRSGCRWRCRRGSRLVGARALDGADARGGAARRARRLLPRGRRRRAPRRAPRTAGLAELGLPYERIRRSRATSPRSSRQHGREPRDGASGRGSRGPTRPAVNGGVFTPREVRERRGRGRRRAGSPARRRWCCSATRSTSPSRAAPRTRLVRRGIGPDRRRQPRAFYVGIAAPEGERALCVVPRAPGGGRASRSRAVRARARPAGRGSRCSPRRGRALERPGDVVDLDRTTSRRCRRSRRCTARTAPRRARGAGAARGGAHRDRHARGSGAPRTDRDARWKLEFSLRGAGARAAPRTRAPRWGRRRAVDEARAQVELYCDGAGRARRR